MTQTLDLNKMGLAPMQKSEMQEVNGGMSWDELMGLFKWSNAIMDANGMSSLNWNNIGGGLFASSGGGVFYQFT